jgi:hypothetical protein
MPLVGFLSMKEDPGRISTITTGVGDKQRRKKILPLMGAPLPETKGDGMYLRLYVRDCPSHEHGGVAVPVELMRLGAGQKWAPVGMARCCPLCWLILVKPSGIYLPDPLPQPVMKAQIDKLQRMALKVGRLQASRKKRPPSALQEKILDFSASGETFTELEIRTVTGKSRTAIRAALLHLLERKEIIVVEQGARGRGKSTQYQSA